MDNDSVRLLRIETPEAVTVSYPMAGIGSRGLAAVLDLAIILFLVVAEIAAAGLVLLGGSNLFGIMWQEYATPWVLAALVVAVFVTYWGYFIFGEVFQNGQTQGKRIAGIRVTRDDGSRVGVLDSIIRNVVRVIDLLPGTYAVGIVSIIFSAQNKRLGDLAAGTVVIVDEEPVALATIGPAEERAALVSAYLARREDFTAPARAQILGELLGLYGVEAAVPWDEESEEERVRSLAGV